MDVSYNKIYNQNNIDDEIICLICLQETIIEIQDKNILNQNTIMVNSIPFLTKSCVCDYHVHYKCIEKWMKINSICPICRKPISNILTIKSQDTIIIPDEETIIIPYNENTYILPHGNTNNEHYKKCVRIIMTVICIMMGLIILNRWL